MIVKENNLRYAKLIHVSVDNGQTSSSNKVYIMEELVDGTIKCEYGRFGKNMVTIYKPSREWNKIIRDKTSSKKGYTDVTDLMVEVVVNESKSVDNKVNDIKNAIVKKLVEELMSFANKSIQRNYKVSQDAVSEQQVNAAQEVINSINGLLVMGVNKKHVNDMLLKLFTIIPRKMDNVKTHLIDGDDATIAQNIIIEEQSALDTMAGQVALIKKQKEVKQEPEENDSEIVEQKTILDQMGLTIEVENDTKTLSIIKKMMGPNVKQMKSVFKVTNKKTQKLFDDNLLKTKVKNKELYFHGSRNANWFNIIQTGLLIRPSGAVHTGSMFGDGIYGASKSQKSIGYTSLRGSYWSKGSDDKAYLAIFAFNVGNQKHIYKHDYSCNKLNYKDLQTEGFDSVYAHGGADLRNDEFIIYNPAQCTITHLIEITN